MHTGMMMRVLLLARLLPQVYCDMDLDGYWMSWKTEFNKNYSSVREESYRRAIWEQKVSEVRKHNEEAAAGQHTFTIGINHLSDMTTEEINAKLNGLRLENFPPVDSNENFTFLSGFALPPSVNWTEDGFVTPVQNQGDCDACWAFSAVGALEAQMKRKKGRLVPLSVQNLVDCSKGEGNHGCFGGLMTNAFTFIVNQQGISQDSDYPYEEKEGYCRPYPKYAHCSGFRVLRLNDEFELQKVVAYIGPVAVGINAACIHQYQSGIHYNCSCSPYPLNHAVLVVGYGTEKGQQYWLIKNSWGTNWGEGGYLRLQRNKNNMCGIGIYSVVPIV